MRVWRMMLPALVGLTVVTVCATIGIVKLTQYCGLSSEDEGIVLPDGVERSSVDNAD